MTIEHEHVHNVTLPSGHQGREYRNGRGKVIRIGDMIRVDGKTAMWRVTEIRVEQHPNPIEPFTPIPEVFITAYGGPKGRLLTRTFHVDRCARALKGEDNNESYREALHETASASKSKRRGWQ